MNDIGTAQQIRGEALSDKLDQANALLNLIADAIGRLPAPGSSRETLGLSLATTQSLLADAQALLDEGPIEPSKRPALSSSTEHVQ